MLKPFFLAAMLSIACTSTCAQYIQKIKADSVKITSDTQSGELIIENSTKNIDGYLYNKGNGRTEFRPLSGGSAGWQLSGNAGITAGQFLGTTDTSKLVIKTNSLQRAAVTGDGTFVIGPSDTAANSLFKVFPNGDFLINAANRDYTNLSPINAGIRYHKRLGYLELGGTRNVIDTTLSSDTWGGGVTSGLIINNDIDANYIRGKLKSSIVAAYGLQMQPTSVLYHSMITGGAVYTWDTIGHSFFAGNYHFAYKRLNNTAVFGNGQYIFEADNNSLWSGFNNQSYGFTQSSIVGGMQNRIGSAAQLTVGNLLDNRSFASTALGNGNVFFRANPYNSWADINSLSIQPGYVLFSIGNSQFRNASRRSNALTVLYSGRTQINTTGFTDSLSEATATPKAALEIVSKNSGVLLPKLTTAQRDSIISGDLHSGLLLFNTTLNNFEYYNGSAWTSIGAGGSAMQSLKDSAVINWNLAVAGTKRIRLSGNRSLNITGLQPGSERRLIIQQDSIGMRKLTLPGNSFVNNEGNGVLNLSQAAGTADIASFLYDGVNFYWTLQRELTEGPRIARFNFNEIPQNVPGWNDVSGNPNVAVRTITDEATGIGVSSVATNKWGDIGGSTSNNTLGERTPNPAFVWDQQVTLSYWFSATYTYASSASCNLEINGLLPGSKYNIEILASREDADIGTPNRYMRAVCIDNAGETFVENFDARSNTADLINFYNKTPNSSGKILLFIGKKHPADSNNAFGYINGLRITRL
ncbi:MAG: hypothetical protein ABW007_12825 [Chitinophagaceae bacterium]